MDANKGGPTGKASPGNANDHEREGARTSGVTLLIVVVPATGPRGPPSPVMFNVGTRAWFRKGQAKGPRAKGAADGSAAPRLALRRVTRLVRLDAHELGDERVEARALAGMQ